MTRTLIAGWLCVVSGFGALGFGSACAAQTPHSPNAVDESPQPRCSATCTCECDCNCKKGLVNVTPYKNLVLFNFGSTLAGRIELEYERALHRIVSIFGVGYVVLFDSVGNKNLVGFGGLVGARVYMLGGAPEGLWVSWGFGTGYRNARQNRDIKLTGVATGGMLGYTAVWGRFALSGGAGGQFAYGRLKVQGQSVSDKEWNPWLKLGVGAAF